MFAGAVDADTSSLGVTLYQYTASITEHRVVSTLLAATSTAAMEGSTAFTAPSPNKETPKET